MAPPVREINRTTTLTAIAIGLVLGLTGVSGAALADPGTSGIDVDTGEAEECSQSLETPAGEDLEVTYPCDPVETETCYIVIHDPHGMPQVLPYPCGVTVNPPSQTAESKLICWGVSEDPWGMPQLYPYPCAIDEPL